MSTILPCREVIDLHSGVAIIDGASYATVNVAANLEHIIVGNLGLLLFGWKMNFAE